MNKINASEIINALSVVKRICESQQYAICFEGKWNKRSFCDGCPFNKEPFDECAIKAYRIPANWEVKEINEKALDSFLEENSEDGPTEEE